MGLRVLHYHQSKQRLSISTCPEALFALGWVPRLVNEDKVADTLANRGLNGETTYFRDISRVLPGWVLHVTRNGASRRQFWDPHSVPDVRFKRDEEYVDALRHYIEVAVRSNLRSRKVPCATITGGLDSSTLSVVAADILAEQGGRLNTFTAVPESGFSRESTPYRYFDETEYVRQIAELNTNIDPHFVPPSTRPLVDQIADEVRIGGAPSGGILNGLWVLDIAEAARRAGHNVMISGDMGNLTMSYHGSTLLAELVATGHLVRAAGEVLRSHTRRKRVLKQGLIAPFVPSRLFAWYQRRRRGGRPPWHSYSALREDFAVQSGVIARAAREHFPFDAPPPRDSRRSRMEDIQSYSETADWFAKLRMAYGVDVRTPAFDRRLVEFCLGVPMDQYLRNGCDRWLIRRAMRGRLPDAVLNNHKSGMQAADWFQRLTRDQQQMREAISRYAKHEKVAAIIDCERLTKILDRWPEAEPPAGSEASMLVSYALPQAIGAAAFIEGLASRNSPAQ